jgi:hypothetical protein
MFNQNPASYPMYNQRYTQNNGYRSNMNYNQFVPTTNKIFVNSLQDALSKPADFNSQMVYFDYNRNVMYDICTNGMGEKSYTVLNISAAPVTDGAAIQTSNFEEYNERLKTLETKMEELMNGKYNVKQTDSANG